MNISQEDKDRIKQQFIACATNPKTGETRPLSDLEFFQASQSLGLNQHHADYRHLFEYLANWIKAELRIGSSLEFGAGSGYLISCLNYLGIDAVGVDGNRYSQKFFQDAHPAYAHQHILDSFFEKRYSPAQAFIAIEVFEHIPDKGLEKIMSKVREEIQPQFIVFSSTPYADENPLWDIVWGHCNIKQPYQWTDFFQNFGYELAPIKPPVTEWASLYVDSRSPV